MNMVEKIVFEPLADSHREAVIRIFNHYVMNGTAAFSDAELPESFYPHILERVKGYPAYAVVDCRTGEVIGFCFLSAYKPVPTFRETATITYFITPSHLGRGIDRMCLGRLEKDAVKQGIRHIIAEISWGKGCWLISRPRALHVSCCPLFQMARLLVHWV